MAIVRDRVVITCVVFNYGEFIGLKLYNIDRDLFQDVFKDSLYLFNIWGLSKEAKNYLYQNKRLKNIPIFQSNELKITDGFRCCPDFYRL